jgi:hypothetical protein
MDNHLSSGPTTEVSKTMQRKGGSGVPMSVAMRELSAAGVLATCETGYFKGQNPQEFKAYRDRALRDLGAPADPIEIMLIEQCLSANQAANNLRVQLAGVTDTSAVGLLTSAVSRMMAEFRRTALALKQYRAPPSAAQLTVVQNTHVTTGDQQVAVIGNPSDLPRSEKNGSESQLVSTSPLEALPHEPLSEFCAESPTSRCRPAEPLEAQRLDPCRTRKAQAGRRVESPLAVFNGSED